MQADPALRTTVAGIVLPCCVYNASGPRTAALSYLEEIGKSASGAILSKSATLLARKGNEFPRYAERALGPDYCPGSINSEGLPNKGINYYIDPQLITALSVYNKPYFLSLSGLSLTENLEMLDLAGVAEGIASIELNLACPNIPGKPILAYDFEQMDEVLSAVCAHPAFSKRPLGVKLAPYFDFSHFQRAAEILNKHPIRYVVCTNTIGNALIVDADREEPIIAPKQGFGGLGGGYIKHIALANVRQMSQLLRPDIDVVGVGGVSTGRDAFELILCGAKAVQVGTKHYKEGATCFNRISTELLEIMRKKGYTSIEDFRGRVKLAPSGGSTRASKSSEEDEAEADGGKKANGGDSSKDGASSGGLASLLDLNLQNLVIFALVALVALLMTLVDEDKLFSLLRFLFFVRTD